MFHRTSGNPFEEESLPKAYYFPSLEKHLSARLKRTHLSPKKETDDTKATSKADERFLQESDKLEIPTREDGTIQHELSSGSQFDESWPSTDRNVSSLSQPTPSSSTLTEKEKDQLAVNKILINKDDTENRLSHPSTLSKYVERFRHGAPSSRKDRQDSSSSDFWWLSPPNTTSTPKETSSTSNSKLESEISSKMRRDAPSSSHSQQRKRNQFSRPGKETTEAIDCNTTNLLARTNQLLEKSEHTLSEASSSDSIPKAPSAWMVERQKRLDNALEARSSVTKPRVAREDDILYQWRLARRLEKAQEHVKDGLYYSPSGNRAAVITTGGKSTQFAEQGHSKYHTDTEHRTYENTTIRLVGRMPANRTSKMEEVVEHANDKTWKNHGNMLGEYARGSNSCEGSIECPQKSGGIEMFPPDSNEEKVPRHVHTMCDIMPCPKHMCSHPTRRDVETQCSSVSDLGKPSTTLPQKTRTEETDLTEDPHHLQKTSSSVVHDTAAAGSVTNELTAQVSRSGINVLENGRGEIETSDKPALLSSTKQSLSAKSETVESDTARQLLTTVQSHEDNQDVNDIARSAAQDLLPDKVSKTTDNIGRKSIPKGSDDGTGPIGCLSLSPHQGAEKDELANVQHNEAIGTVIGQVISERLFSFTSTSHRSSLSSECTESGSVEERNDAVANGTDCENHNENEMEQKLHTITATHGAALFCDDDMLIRLRQQAEFYRIHLRNIDRILELMKE